MFPTPVAALDHNTAAYESLPLVKPTGFREYDARWYFEKEINLMGVQALGMGLGTLIRELGVKPEIVVGHDYRSYSQSIKLALVNGLMSAGCKVHDIGLAMSPMAYFAQFALDVPCVAMVTASHNDNGWTGVKMGAQRPVTFGPDEMGRLRDIVIGGLYSAQAGGSYHYVQDFAATYIADLTKRAPFKRRIKAVAACGNGTAGAFAPQILEALGVDVIPMDTKLDFTFTHYNRRDAGARSLALASGGDLRGGCEINGPVRHRSRTDQERRQGRFLENRPFLYQTAGGRVERSGGL